MTVAISTRYSAKKYSSRRGIDSMRSINEALGDTPELPFWLPGSGICDAPVRRPLKPGRRVASMWPAPAKRAGGGARIAHLAARGHRWPAPGPAPDRPGPSAHPPHPGSAVDGRHVGGRSRCSSPCAAGRPPGSAPRPADRGGRSGASRYPAARRLPAPPSPACAPGAASARRRPPEGGPSGQLPQPYRCACSNP
ncbi:hypothetical protein G6F50_014608 [Rhizopus delemar]|uniref:Uncharacterized protein n=1 Tax=Rhizopus delemar TaxID=936053 RepID=A0A9P6Y4H1_9FUNG|nr:hypothetical protein G6F50_014608 [Rhizopus delemar]